MAATWHCPTTVTAPRLWDSTTTGWRTIFDMLLSQSSGSFDALTWPMLAGEVFKQSERMEVGGSIRSGEGNLSRHRLRMSK